MSGLDEQRDPAFLRGLDEAARAFMPILDDLDHALRALRAQAANQAVSSGLEALRERVVRSAAALGFTVEDPVGERFDPQRHEALALVPSSLPEGCVAEVHRRGWIRAGVLVRAALVSVSNGAAPAPTVPVPVPQQPGENDSAQFERRRYSSRVPGSSDS